MSFIMGLEWDFAPLVKDLLRLDAWQLERSATEITITDDQRATKRHRVKLSQLSCGQLPSDSPRGIAGDGSTMID